MGNGILFGLGLTVVLSGRKLTPLLATGLLIGIATVGPSPAGALTAEEKARLDRGAHATVDELQALLDEDTTNHRTSCAMGEAPDWVRESRARYPNQPFADASGMCVSILGSKGKSGQLGELYQGLLTKLGGDVASADRWPRAIGDAALADKTTVAIGHDKAIGIKPALAFDAGFTVAYQEGDASREQNADKVQLQAIAENCLAQRQDAGTCFSVGYLYGATSYRGRSLLAR